MFVYLDDSSGTEEEHCRHLQEVFKRLSKAGLAINLPKSEFFASELEFLRHVINSDCIRPSQKQMAAVRDYQDISKFLGLLNFFRFFYQTPPYR